MVCIEDTYYNTRGVARHLIVVDIDMLGVRPVVVGDDKRRFSGCRADIFECAIGNPDLVVGTKENGRQCKRSRSMNALNLKMVQSDIRRANDRDSVIKAGARAVQSERSQRHS